MLVLQTITPVQDITDEQETRVIKHRHNQMTWGLIESLSGKLQDFLPAMAGPCQLAKNAKKEKKNPAVFQTG